MAGVAGEAAVVPRPRHPAWPTVPSPEHAELLRALECIDLMDASEKEEEEDDVLVVGVIRPAAVMGGTLMRERQPQQQRQRGGQDAGPSSLQPVAIDVASPAVLSLEQRLLLRMANRQQHPAPGQQPGVAQPSPGLLAIRHQQRQQLQQAAAASSSSPAAGRGSLLSSASSDEGQRPPASGGAFTQMGAEAATAAAAAQLAGLSLSRFFCGWEDSPSGSRSSPASVQARSAARSGSGFNGSGSGAGFGMPGITCVQDAGQPEAARKRARSGKRQDVARYPGGDRTRVSVTASVTGWGLEAAEAVGASPFQSPAGAVSPDEPRQGGGLVAMEVIEIPDSATPVPLRRRLEQRGSRDSDVVVEVLGQGSGASMFPHRQQPSQRHVIDLLSDDGEDE